MPEETPPLEDGYAEALLRINAVTEQGPEGTELDLSWLGLTSLPPEIGDLTALTGLYLWRNQLTTLPAEISNLTALTTLDLDTNQLTSLPPEIGDLKALRKLNLDGNPALDMNAVRRPRPEARPAE